MSESNVDLAKSIDHAVLKPEMTDVDLREHAAMCEARGVGYVCVKPCDVKLAVECLRHSVTAVASVVGFPHGNSRPEVKALEARLAIEDGAEELDMVMNIGWLRSGNVDGVREDIQAVVAEAKPEGVPVKVILETCLLTPEEISCACALAEAAGADFVKTSTGFNGGGATTEAVARMLDAVGGRMKVKASGGIRTWAEAVGFLEQGCSRLGIGSTEAVLDGETGTGGY